MSHDWNTCSTMRSFHLDPRRSGKKARPHVAYLLESRATQPNARARDGGVPRRADLIGLHIAQAAAAAAAARLLLLVGLFRIVHDHRTRGQHLDSFAASCRIVGASHAVSSTYTSIVLRGRRKASASAHSRASAHSALHGQPESHLRAASRCIGPPLLL